MNKIVMGICVIIAGLFSCKTSYETPEEFPKSQIIVGNGGGFTGKEQIYTVLENGQMFHYNGIKETQSKMERLDKAKTKQLFADMKAADITNIKCNDPGNMYYFVAFKKGEEEHKATWGGSKQEAPAALEAIYKQVMKKAIDENNGKSENANKM